MERLRELEVIEGFNYAELNGLLESEDYLYYLQHVMEKNAVDAAVSAVLKDAVR